MKPTRSIIPLFLFLLFTSLASANKAALSIEAEALLQWKATLFQPSFLSSWSTINGTSPCLWYGIQCDSPGNVVQISLPNSNLNLSSGNLVIPVPHQLNRLGKLKHFDIGGNQLKNLDYSICSGKPALKYLSLYQNDLTGFFPPFILNCTNLIYLDLSGNEFNGSLPDNLPAYLPHLKYLNLTGNSFTGTLPVSIKNLKNLTDLHLSNNNFFGGVPPWMGSISGLEILDLAGNSLGGPIPSSLGQLKLLKEIYLSSADLNSTIPPELGLCTNLEYLDLSDNQLIGGLPKSLANLTKMAEFLIADNLLNGEIPSYFFVNWTNLIWFQVENNSFTGKIPSEIGLPKKLQVLSLSINNLTGEIPSEIGNLTSLWALDVSMNSLSGPIFVPFRHDRSRSWNFSFLPAMQYLFLSDNFLNGNIPSICKINSLIVLDLSRNQFSGELPKCLWEMKNLEFLALESNNLSGNIPISKGRMPPLQSINLANNSLTGEFPSALKKCSDLTILDLGFNYFSGEIPEWVGYSFPSLMIFSLGWNSFNGSIPPLNGLEKLQLLDFSHNNLTGRIPPSVGDLISMALLQNYSVMDYMFVPMYDPGILITWKGSEFSFKRNIMFVSGIDFSSNSLTQEIPRELTSLIGLIFLNLSENYLTGQIPERIGELRQLQFLDLSNNEISGVIPTSMANLGFLSVLDLSYNNLSGEIPTGNQLQTLDNPLDYVGNEGLCGFPLAKACSVDEPPTQNQSLPDDNEEKIDKILFYGFIVFGFAFGFWSFFGVLFFNTKWRWNYFYFIDSMQQKISEKF